jgi:hypothetical protein
MAASKDALEFFEQNVSPIAWRTGGKSRVTGLRIDYNGIRFSVPDGEGMKELLVAMFMDEWDYCHGTEPR